MMQVAFETLGCRLNEAESEAWARHFQSAGSQIVPANQADLVIVNTCAVTSEAVRKSRQLIRRMQRQNPAAKVVVSGCYATLHPDQAARELGVDLVVLNRDKEQLVTLAQSLIESNEVAVPQADMPAPFIRTRQRAFIKVQDGCRHRCTFCIVTIARGEERSRPIEAIVDEVCALHAQGFHEIVITGVHLGGYGSDLRCSLGDLLHALLERTDIPRIRLGSLEPWELSEGFFELFQNPRLMPHLHLPLQSGSDAILKRMGRRCRREDFFKLVETAHRFVPDINLTTDIIVGFPGESEEDFYLTKTMVQEIGFSHVHIFSYSPRHGTPAATFPNQVPAEIKKIRSQELHQLVAKMRHSALTQQIGKTATVLWEQVKKEGGLHFYGYSPHYHKARIAVSDNQDLTNIIAEVRFVGVDPSGSCLLSEPV